MKRLFVIIVALFVGFAYAANENVPTSKKFVDAALAQKQPKFDGLGNDKLMLYSNTTDGVVASRDIVTTLGNSTSADSVPTVGAINAGLATKQDILNGDAGWVAENTGIAGAVTQKPIYSATNNYSNALVEVETLNNAVINAVNSELTVVPGVGWTINTASNLNLLPTPQTYNDVPPGGYTRLEYLTSTGTQYIDTGIIPTNATGLDIKFNKTAQGDQVIMGVLYDSDMKAADLYVNLGSTNHLYVPFGEDWTTAGYDKLQYDTDYNVRINYMNDRNRYVDYVPAGRIDKTLTGATDTMYLFAGHRVPRHGPGWFFIGRIYYLKITEGNQLVRNFIPARRNSDNTLGMYDTVSGTFFTNAGTGADFTAGPVVTGN